MSPATLAPVLALLFLAAEAPQASGPVRPRDSYVLSHGDGDRASISSGSLENLIAVRHRYTGSFLWARRRGREVVIRDPKVLAQANAVFEPLHELEPERDALEEQQRRLEKEEAKLDAVEDELERDRDALEDEAEGATPPAAATAEQSFEERHRQIDAARRPLERRERELDAAERALDSREEEIEKRAEAKLWTLVDDAIARGLAEDAP
jgi:hypothetical protein